MRIETIISKQENNGNDCHRLPVGDCLAAALVGLILLLPKSVRRKNETTVAVEKAVPVCQTAEVCGSKVRNYHYPVPEELEESVPCIESPGSGPLDDRMSDIEAAIGDSSAEMPCVMFLPH